MKVHFKSEPMLIGQHEWRVIVVDFLLAGKRDRAIRYQWREPGAELWRDDKSWPTYDHDHAYGGMPKKLADLYENNLASLEEALGERLPGSRHKADQMNLL